MNRTEQIKLCAYWAVWFVCAVFLVVSVTSCASREVALVAKKQVGTHYAKGEKYQCGNFVAYCVRKAGKDLPDNPALARDWLDWGKPVPWALKQPGDVVVVWRGSKDSDSGHVLIYVGDDRAVHRSTYKSPVQYIDINRYLNKVLGVRRG
jgi:cell wall-associated NlpC family hydrolase